MKRLFYLVFFVLTGWLGAWAQGMMVWKDGIPTTIYLADADSITFFTSDDEQLLVRERLLTIKETAVTGSQTPSSLMRASLREEEGQLTASWTEGDKLTYCNLSRTYDYAIYSGELTAVTTDAVSQFTGSVTCYTGDYLAVVYPATTFATNTSYTISLSGQDGTLETLARDFHCVYGKALVKSVSEGTATAEMMKMKSLLTVCKFSFIDKVTSQPILVKSLNISYGGDGSDAGKYPQTATVSIRNISNIIEQADIHAAGVSGSTTPLSITCLAAVTNVYVALLPTGGQRTFQFTVTDNNGNTYNGTAKATLTEGKYVTAAGLKLNKTN